MSIIDEAKDIRGGSRQSDYGDCVANMQRISAIASLINGKEITPKECAIVQIAVKLSRESFKHKRDNLVDLIGYADILNEVIEANNKPLTIDELIHLVNELNQPL